MHVSARRSGGGVCRGERRGTLMLGMLSSVFLLSSAIWLVNESLSALTQSVTFPPSGEVGLNFLA